MALSPQPPDAELDRDWIGEQKRITSISSRYVTTRELEDGYAYGYPQGSRAEIEEVRDFLSMRFEALDCAVAEEADGMVWLRITGGPDVKAWLRRGLEFRAGRWKEDGTQLLSTWQRRSRLATRLATAPLRMLPDFLLIGVAKAATTSLYSYLCEHPDVAPAFRKECYFFDMSYRRGITYYRAMFPLRLARTAARARGHRLLTGEATPCYLFHPHVPARVRRHLPNARLLVLLRNPIDRAYSHWAMNRRRGLDRLEFAAAVEQEPERTAGELQRMIDDPGYFSTARHHLAYLERGHYAEQLERWFEVFPREQILLLENGELARDRGNALQRVITFLGLRDATMPDTGRRNYAPYEPLPDAVRSRLQEHFRPHNERLFDLIGRRFDW